MSDSERLDPVAAFASDLRALRLNSGNPTLTAIEKSSGVSKSVVSEALAGRRLPSARTVKGIVTACEGDVSAWVARRDAIAATVTEVAEAPADDAVLPAQPRRVRLSLAIVAAAAALIVGVGGTLALDHGTGAVSAHAATAPTPTAAIPTDDPTVVPAAIQVKVGTDPADTKCVNDAVVATSETGADGAQLQIIYSAACHAVWSRITRYDNKATGNEVSTSIYRQIAPNASDRQSTVEPDAQSAYTTLLIRPTPETQICAIGSFTVSGKTISWGPPICL